MNIKFALSLFVLIVVFVSACSFESTNDTTDTENTNLVNIQYDVERTFDTGKLPLIPNPEFINAVIRGFFYKGYFERIHETNPSLFSRYKLPERITNGTDGNFWRDFIAECKQTFRETPTTPGLQNNITILERINTRTTARGSEEGLLLYSYYLLNLIYGVDEDIQNNLDPDNLNYTKELTNLCDYVLTNEVLFSGTKR